MQANGIAISPLTDPLHRSFGAKSLAIITFLYLNLSANSQLVRNSIYFLRLGRAGWMPPAHKKRCWSCQNRSFNRTGMTIRDPSRIRRFPQQSDSCRVAGLARGWFSGSQLFKRSAHTYMKLGKFGTLGMQVA